ncbi:uncharacterized protein LOC120348728 [Nilaparvata lugens]|uniref:uncharacterized protein LOC120348728 n=1 Tax=Nilaparvata lugens TaxID=108931 RepID=UPI00193E2B1C|nr:uncharacterized protein LOC120348728 [Nilaparvata lugens]
MGQGCKARARMRLGIDEPIIPTETSPLHNHQPDELRAAKNKFLSRLKERATSERTRVSEIFEEEAIRHPEAASNLSKENAQRSMGRAKKIVEPTGTPHSLEETRERLVGRGLLAKTRDGVEEFLLEEEFIEEGCAIAMGFGSRRTIQIMRQHPGEACHIFMDATFKVVPKQPERLRQLFSVHILFRNVVSIPSCVFLMHSKTEEHYTRILSYLKENIITWEIQHIMTDFERGLMNAISQVWPSPGTQHHGCWFHYCQSIWRAVVSYGLVQATREDPALKRVIKLIMAIPHLPAEAGSIHSNEVPPFSIADGLAAVKRFAREENLLNEALARVFAYVRRYWLLRVGAQRLSVFRLPNRTNNCVESFHAKLLAALGPHLNIFEFIGGLQRIEQEFYFKQLRNDNILDLNNRNRGRMGRLTTAGIADSMNLLVRRQISLIDFLKRVSHQTDSLFDVFNHSLQANEGLFAEELEVDIRDEWITLDVDEEEDEEEVVVVEEAAAVPAVAEPVPERLVQRRPRGRGQSRGRRGQQLRGARGRSRLQQRGQGMNNWHNFGRCTICLDLESTHAAIPCGHICMCTRCANLNRQHNPRDLRCPLCNIPSTEYVRMWASDTV